jgi:Uma2 family endonuclease
MPSPPLKMSVEEYLRTSFDGADVEYLDGELVERNMGNKSHGRVQYILARLLGEREAETGLYVVVEVRTRVNLTRYRIPDVAVYEREPDEEVPVEPPFVAVEVLSPDDRVSYMFPKLIEYLNWGVRHIWLLDPEDRKMFLYGATGLSEVTEFVLPEQGVRISLADVFGEPKA